MRASNVLASVICLHAAALLPGQQLHAQTTWYVDDDAMGANDGTSWADAFVDLQDALDGAGAGDEIWVARGVYAPDRGTGDQTASFCLSSGVAIYGGYAGYGAPDPDARDPATYKTILSGDLAGDDGTYFLSHRENSLHVVVGSGTGSLAVLDGFTVSGGYASGSGTDDYGAGMYNDQGSPVVSNCVFEHNEADGYGAGIYNSDGSSPVVVGCRFERNAAYAGAGVASRKDSSPLVLCCDFIDNDGGAMYNSEFCYSKVVGCRFIGNQSYMYGAGMYNTNLSSALVLNCIFTGNSASSGGAIYNFMYSDTAAVNCTFSGNTATYDCGGMLSSRCYPTVSNCIFWGNSSGNQGLSEAAQLAAAPMNVNCCCVQGWTGALGGTGNLGTDPLFIDRDGPDDVLGTADDDLRLGAGSPCIDAGSNYLVPPDVFDLDGDDVIDEPLPFDVVGGPRFLDDPYVSPDPGMGIPPIIDMGAYEGARQAFVLESASITVPEGGTATFTVAMAMDPLDTVEAAVVRDTGDEDILVQTGAMLTFDSDNYATPQPVILFAAEDDDCFDGSATFVVFADGAIAAQIKAKEADNETVPATLFVDDDMGTTGCGADWSTAIRELQTALAIAVDRPEVTEIRVAQGTYRPDLRSDWPAGGTGGRDIAFRLLGGVALRGGYAGFGAPDPNARDPDSYPTTLSGDIGAPSVILDNSIHVLDGSGTDATAVLEGFVVTAGCADRIMDRKQGAGLYNKSGDPMVTNCRFEGNMAYIGGAMYNAASSPVVSHCTFQANVTELGGSGAYNENDSTPTFSACDFISNVAAGPYGDAAGLYSRLGSDPTLLACAFLSNAAGEYGGAVFCDGNASLISCTFVGNSARFGGGASLSYGNAQVVNCLFDGNQAELGGGVYNHTDSSAMLTNCTLVDNEAQTGGGVYNRDQCDPVLANCILWSNTDDGGMNEAAQITGASRAISYSCVYGLDALAGNGNIGEDPRFVDADGPDGIPGNEDDDLRLQTGSPCMDAGDNTVVCTLADLDGLPRFADEPSAPEAGYGTSPLVDMGSYEFQASHCPGDLSGDGVRNITDFVFFASAFGSVLGDFDYGFYADMNGDAVVNVTDFTIFANLYGTACP